MAGWDALHRELDAWAEAGEPATLWWRDDDAATPSPALDRLLQLAGGTDVPLALAVVPAGAGPPLVEALAGHAEVLVHGLAHRNLAPAGERKAEFGPHRPLQEMLADAGEGRERLRGLFGKPALPVFVPPWNRIAPALVARLAEAGFAGISTLGPRVAAEAAPGLAQVNCHLDPIDWRGSRGFVGEAAALEALVGHLQARRRGGADRAEPSGVMTHHLVQDEATWAFLERLFAETGKRDGAHWLSAREAFSLAP